MKKHRIYFLSFIAIMMLLSACKKEATYPDLQSTWVLDHTRLTFSGNTFTYELYTALYPESDVYTILRGDVSSNGNSLTFTIRELENFDRVFNPSMTKPEIIKKNEKIFDQATFKIVKRKLELSYLSYPADYPMATKKVFKRK